MESSTFRLATFNVNSLRARMDVVFDWMERYSPDLLCLQETKVQDKDFPLSRFQEAGYQVAFRGQKSYNGVAAVSRHSLEEVSFGLGDQEDSEEDRARLIRLTVMGVRVINTYVPQGRDINHPYFQHKLRWFGRLLGMLARDYRREEDVLWVGDMNVAPGPLDLYAPERKQDHVCFHASVREAFHEVTRWGFEDVYRMFHKEGGRYTFFDYRIRGAVKRNLGWRIDHIMATRPLARRAVGAEIDLEVRTRPRPSDHAVLYADFIL